MPGALPQGLLATLTSELQSRWQAAAGLDALEDAFDPRRGADLGLSALARVTPLFHMALSRGGHSGR